jgi:hypothetical protein
VAAHGLVLLVAAERFQVLVALVTGDVDDNAHAPRLPHALEHVHRAHDVRGIGADRVAVRAAHEGLRGQVQDDVGRKVVHRRVQAIEVADVSEGRIDELVDAS